MSRQDYSHKARQKKYRQKSPRDTEAVDDAANARLWMQKMAENSQDEFVRALAGDTAIITGHADFLYLGLDYDENTEDIDGDGPF